MQTPRSTTIRRLPGSCVVLAAVTVLGIGLAACGGVDDSAGDDDYPSKSIELTAPSSAGGSTDLISRAVAKAAEKPLGQSVVVVNKEGANGAIGGKEVLNSRADGYKMVLLPQSLFAIGPLLEADSGAIDLADMSYVAGLTVEDYVMTVPASSPAKSIDDLIQAAPVTFGTTGAGTGSQLAQALLFASAKVKATDVPFDGGSELITALLGKQVDVGVNQIAEAVSQIKAGKLRPIAVFAQERVEALPEVKTATEQGYDIVVNQRRWLAAPKDVPESILESMRESIATAKEDPGFQTFLKDNSIETWDIEPDEVKAEVESARQQYADLSKQFGVDLAG
jgi:tripartite-type tricarboxylate transporter receptor subunit TctC